MSMKVLTAVEVCVCVCVWTPYLQGQDPNPHDANHTLRVMTWAKVRLRLEKGYNQASSGLGKFPGDKCEPM